LLRCTADVQEDDSTAAIPAAQIVTVLIDLVGFIAHPLPRLCSGLISWRSVGPTFL